MFAVWKDPQLTPSTHIHAPESMSPGGTGVSLCMRHRVWFLPTVTLPLESVRWRKTVVRARLRLALLSALVEKMMARSSALAMSNGSEMDGSGGVSASRSTTSSSWLHSFSTYTRVWCAWCACVERRCGCRAVALTFCDKDWLCGMPIMKGTGDCKISRNCFVVGSSGM